MKWPVLTKDVKQKYDQYSGKKGGGIGQGGIAPCDVNTLMTNFIERDKIHFPINGGRQVNYLFTQQELGNDPFKPVQYVGIVDKVVNLSGKDNNIYISSFPVNDEHQISLLFDNKNKKVYMADSLKSYDETSQLPSITNLKTKLQQHGISLEFYHNSHKIALQKPHEISCGMHTFVNSLNKASELLDIGNCLKLSLNDKLIIKNMIIDRMDSDDRVKLNADVLDLAAFFYQTYLNLQATNPPEAEKVKQFLDQEVFKHLDSNEVNINEKILSKFSNYSIDEKNILDKVEGFSIQKSTEKSKILFEQFQDFIQNQGITGSYNSLVDLMKNSSFYPDFVDSSGYSLLHYATANISHPNSKKIIFDLLDIGANPYLLSSVDSVADSPLSILENNYHKGNIDTDKLREEIKSYMALNNEFMTSMKNTKPYKTLFLSIQTLRTSKDQATRELADFLYKSITQKTCISNEKLTQKSLDNCKSAIDIATMGAKGGMFFSNNLDKTKKLIPTINNLLEEIKNFSLEDQKSASDSNYR